MILLYATSKRGFLEILPLSGWKGIKLFYLLIFQYLFGPMRYQFGFSYKTGQSVFKIVKYVAKHWIIVQRDKYSIWQQTGLCTVGRRRLTWRHGNWHVLWFNRIWVHPTHSWFAVRLWSPHELVLAWFSSCIEHVFIYDQYLLTQSASQFLCPKLNVCTMTELLVGIYGLRVLPTCLHPAISISGIDWKMLCTRQTPRTLEELKRNIRDEINNIKRE